MQKTTTKNQKKPQTKPNKQTNKKQKNTGNIHLNFIKVWVF